MTTLIRSVSVLERSPVVKDLRIVQELHVARLEIHPQLDARIFGNFVQQIERSDLGVR